MTQKTQPSTSTFEAAAVLGFSIVGVLILAAIVTLALGGLLDGGGVLDAVEAAAK